MSNRNKFILSIVWVFASIALLTVTTILAEQTVISTTFADTLMAVSLVLLFGALYFAIKIDYKIGIYECRNCGHVFKPTFTAYLFGAHTLTTRCLKCPNCGKITWCRRKTTER